MCNLLAGADALRHHRLGWHGVPRRGRRAQRGLPPGGGRPHRPPRAGSRRAASSSPAGQRCRRPPSTSGAPSPTWPRRGGSAAATIVEPDARRRPRRASAPPMRRQRKAPHHDVHEPRVPGFYPDPSVCRVGERLLPGRLLVHLLPRRARLPVDEPRGVDPDRQRPRPPVTTRLDARPGTGPRWASTPRRSAITTAASS